MNRTILFVDDERNILQALQRLFLDDDWLQVRTSTNAGEAIDILAQESIDMLVSDQMMAEMNGSELLSTVQKLYPDISLVLLTGYADQLSDSITQALGPDVVIVAKPWDIDALRSIVRKNLLNDEG